VKNLPDPLKPTPTAVLAIDRLHGQCAYPLWQGHHLPYTHQFSCGAPVYVGAYCSAHAALCYRLDATKAGIERELAYAAKHIGAKVGASRDFIASL